MRNDSITRLITVSIFGILGLWLLYTLLFGTGMSMGFGVNRYFGGEHMNMGYGFGFGFGNGGTLAYLLILLVKVLFVVFVIALVAAIVVWIKNNVFTREDIDVIKNSFRVSNTASQKEQCVACGKTMESDWKLCPHCGKEKGI